MARRWSAGRRCSGAGQTSSNVTHRPAKGAQSDAAAVPALHVRQDGVRVHCRQQPQAHLSRGRGVRPRVVESLPVLQNVVRIHCQPSHRQCSRMAANESCMHTCAPIRVIPTSELLPVLLFTGTDSDHSAPCASLCVCVRARARACVWECACVFVSATRADQPICCNRRRGHWQ